MSKAFTLLELLVVMMIMALMGTSAIGGYRAMQRGMEERGVIQNANAIIRAAYQRAQIDRQPTAIFFWNETIQSRTEEENEIVVGRAVAVRRHGRLTNVIGKNLVDEFGDLEQSYTSLDDGGSSPDSDVMYLYPMNDLSSSTLNRSLVGCAVVPIDETLIFFTGRKSAKDDYGGEDIIRSYAFELKESGGVNWKTGMAYGFEFMNVQLPRGYIFGSEYSTDAGNPIKFAKSMVFKPGQSSSETIQICSLRPNGAVLKAEAVGTTDSPMEDQ